MKDSVRKKKKNTTPLILALAVVLILIVAPIGSYYFLRSGYEYRVASLEQLKPKEISSQLKGVITLKAPFNGNARLIHIPGDNLIEELKLLHRIDKKIVDRERFEIYSLTTDQDSTDIDNILFIPAELNVQFSEQFILMDTSNIVRGTYEFKGGVQQVIIRHLSVVIPMHRSRTISTKRDSI